MACFKVLSVHLLEGRRKIRKPTGCLTDSPTGHLTGTVHSVSVQQSNWTPHRYSSQCVCTAVHFVANCGTAKCVVWCSQLWDVVWCGVVVCYWCFRSTCWSISVSNYQPMLHNIPGQQRSQLHHGGSLQSCKLYHIFTHHWNKDGNQFKTNCHCY